MIHSNGNEWRFNTSTRLASKCNVIFFGIQCPDFGFKESGNTLKEKTHTYWHKFKSKDLAKTLPLD